LLTTDTYDVVIIGAGPAGLCAAMRLIELNVRVAIVEQKIFPREQIGESLSPGIRNIFDYLGIRDVLDNPSNLSSIPNKIIWEDQHEIFTKSNQESSNIIVNRGVFDATMLEQAKNKGAIIFQPAYILSEIEIDNRWQIKLVWEGKEHIIFSRIIFNARGRKGIRHSDRFLISPPLQALWMNIHQNNMPYESLVEAIPEGWLWGSPLTGHQYRLMLFLNPMDVKIQKAGTVFMKALNSSRLFKGIHPSLLSTRIKSCTAHTYFNATPWKDNYVHLGESAFALDPLSSTGVEKSMRFSLQAAAAVNTSLKRDERLLAKSFYEDRLIETVALHAEWTHAFYQNAWPAYYAPFWKIRSDFEPKSSANDSPFTKKVLQKIWDRQIEKAKPTYHNAAGNSLNDLWQKKVCLSSRLSYSKTPALVNDFIEMKMAIRHPTLEREIVYLEQVEIKPLLDLVSNDQTFGELTDKWSRYIPSEQARRIIIYLWNSEILSHS
jgi:flavin-dependent dehydrogenase